MERREERGRVREMLRLEEASKKVEMMGREGMRVRRYENDSKRGRESE